MLLLADALWADIESEPQHWGRGDWIHGRTLELLDYNGLATDLLATGARVEAFSHHHQQVSSSVSYAPEHVVSKYKQVVVKMTVGLDIRDDLYT